MPLRDRLAQARPKLRVPVEAGRVRGDRIERRRERAERRLEVGLLLGLHVGTALENFRFDPENAGA